MAGVLAGASVLAIECQESRIDFRIRTRYLDYKAHSIDEALTMTRNNACLDPVDAAEVRAMGIRH